MAKCTCHLSGIGSSGSGGGGGSGSGLISGLLRLSQSSDDSATIIEGEIRGLSGGKHGISINVHGDLSDANLNGMACGPIFNPFGKNHGSPEDKERMVGDLGNITVSKEDGKCIVHIEDSMVKLIGPHSVIGRSIVIYSGEDDCGRGGHELSLTTGNSGSRVAVGVIGIAS